MCGLLWASRTCRRTWSSSATGRARAPLTWLAALGYHRLRTGVAWRDLSAEFGPWQTVWKRQYKSSNDGTWDKGLTTLQIAADACGWIDWRVSVDSTIARVHQQGATAARSQSKSTSYTGGTVELQESAR